MLRILAVVRNPRPMSQRPASATTTTTPSTTDSDPAQASILSRQYRATTIGMVALVSLYAFEALAVAAAMPTVARELDGLRLYALAFGGLLATSVVGMTAAGRYSDRHGPARPLGAGITCFVIGLIVSGTASNMELLVVGRLLQGLGAGALSVAIYVLVARLYPDALRPRVFAALSAGWVVPSLLGPGVSGFIVQHWGWRWVFLAVPLLAVPAALLLRGPLRALPPAPPAAHEDGNRSIVPWAAAAALAALALYLGGQQRDWTGAALMLPALLALLYCMRRLLPAGTLRLRRGLPSVIALRGVVPAAFFACEAFIPLLLSRERGLEPFHAGLALSLGALGWFAGSWYQGNAYRGDRRARLVQVGAALMVLGVVATASLLLPTMPLAVALAGWSLTGIGMGLVFPSLSVLVLSLSPPALQGRNSSALQLSEALAVTTMLAVSGSLFAALLSHAPMTGYAAVFGMAVALLITGNLIARRI